MSRPAPITALLTFVVLSACTEGAGPASTNTTLTTTSSSTTTATLGNETEIELGRAGNQKWITGTAYTASGFWVPVSFTVEESETWWARGADVLWVYVEYHEKGGSLTELDLSVLAHAPNEPPSEIVRVITTDDRESDLLSQPGAQRLELRAGPDATTVGGFQAQVFDLYVPYDLWHDQNAAGSSRFDSLLPGLGLLDDEGMRFGVRNGRPARIWVVDVDGATITIIAATSSLERFDDLIAAADELVAGMTFAP